MLGGGLFLSERCEDCGESETDERVRRMSKREKPEEHEKRILVERAFYWSVKMLFDGFGVRFLSEA